MDIEIVRVHNHGDASKEYVHLKAVADCNLQDYMLADSTYTGAGKISNEHRHTYWFPKTDVKKGENIFVWTKDGKNEPRFTESGARQHHFFWRSGAAIWNDAKDKAVLFFIADWKYFEVR